MSRPKHTLLPARADEQVAASSRLILAAAEAALAEPLAPAAGARQAIVLGGGACREIPLEDLASRFDRIVIDDIKPPADSAALVESRIGSADAARLQWRTRDLTGQIACLGEAWRRALDRESTAAAAIEAMSQVAAAPLGAGHEASASAGDPSGERYTLVVASCLLSQLHAPAWQVARDLFAQRFPQATRELAESKLWFDSLALLARALERRFVADLPSLVAPGGRIYLSESVRVSFLNWAGPATWSTRGGLRMTATGDLADYLDSRFVIQTRDRWAWIVAPEEPPGPQGKAFDVQGLVLRLDEANPPVGTR